MISAMVNSSYGRMSDLRARLYMAVYRSNLCPILLLSSNETRSPMKIAAIFFCVAFTIIHLESCNWDAAEPKTEIEKLPAATTSGKHTFGCLVNGKAFVPYSQYYTYATLQNGILQISGEVDIPTEPDPAEYITMVLIEQGTDVLYPGTYELNNPPMRRAGCLIGDCTYYGEHVTSGFVTITKLDRNNLCRIRNV